MNIIMFLVGINQCYVWHGARFLGPWSLRGLRSWNIIDLIALEQGCVWGASQGYYGIHRGGFGFHRLHWWQQVEHLWCQGWNRSERALRQACLLVRQRVGLQQPCCWPYPPHIQDPVEHFRLLVLFPWAFWWWTGLLLVYAENKCEWCPPYARIHDKLGHGLPFVFPICLRPVTKMPLWTWV